MGKGLVLDEKKKNFHKKKMVLEKEIQKEEDEEYLPPNLGFRRHRATFLTLGDRQGNIAVETDPGVR